MNQKSFLDRKINLGIASLFWEAQKEDGEHNNDFIYDSHQYPHSIKSTKCFQFMKKNYSNSL